MAVARPIIFILAWLVWPAMAAAQDVIPDERLGEIACEPGSGRFGKEGFVPIGGIEQWVTISGTRCDNPVVLIVHGGPGNPLSPYTGSPYSDWLGDFTLVHWDQRGAGRTFGRNPGQAGDSLTIERLASDGLELSERVKEGFGNRKLLLAAPSWGTVLAVHMVKAKPDLFRGYVGISQFVRHTDNLGASYARTLELARQAGDAEQVAQLEQLGPPPWANPRAFGILRRATRVYEGRSSDAPPDDWWQPGENYGTDARRAEYVEGEDYSYLQFVGLQGDGMLSKIDLPSLGAGFEVPVTLIQGAEDLVTVPEVAQGYFESISAPKKEFILLPRTGHDPNVAMMTAVRQALKDQSSD